MFILPERHVIVVATPRTGSRSIRDAILEANPPGCLRTKLHHDYPHVVQKAKEQGDHPREVVTIIRNPWSHIVSWLHHAKAWWRQEDYVQNFQGRYFFYHGGMNIYNEVADRFFVFEEDGHRKLLDYIGLEDIELPHVGKSSERDTYKADARLSDSSKEIIRNRFEQDFELYKSVTGKDVINDDYHG